MQRHASNWRVLSNSAFPYQPHPCAPPCTHLLFTAEAELLVFLDEIVSGFCGFAQ